MNVAYIRVSSDGQNEQRQIEAMRDKGIEKYFSEKISGKSMDRPKLQEMVGFIREGDAVFIQGFSRLARNAAHLLKLAGLFEKKGVKLVSVKGDFDTDTATGRSMLTVIAATGEFERENLLERQREGIAIARKEGECKGRKRASLSIDGEVFNSLPTECRERKISKSGFARKLGICRQAFYNLVREKGLDI